MKYSDQKLTTLGVVRAPRYSLFWLAYLLGAIVLVGAPGCTIVAPMFLLGRFWRPLELWAGRCTCVLIRWMFNLNIWIDKRVSIRIPFAIGRTNRPTLLVANHRSNLDVFFLISYIPNIRILAKRSLFWIPFLGPMMWIMRQIPVARGQLTSYLSAIESARLGLRQGDAVLFFPEGQRCPAGTGTTEKFYPAAFSLAKEERVPIYPIVFVNTDRVWPRGKIGMAAGQSVRVISLEPLDPDEFATAQDLMVECQKRINGCLEANR